MKIEYNPNYQKKHLSIRVPWHDNAWNGTVCSNPKNNDACLVLKNCAENRNDEQENELAGKKISDLKDESLFPPCLTERGMFMSNFDITKHIKHPYSTGFNENYKHFLPTLVKFPKYSAPGIPFFYGLPKNAEEIAQQYDLDFDNEREPYVRYNYDPKLKFTTNWIQDYKNQKALFDCFFQHVKAEESLSFFYAKEVPFIEDNNRVLMGIGEITSITQSKEFDRSKESDFKAMPWEHMINHSIRPNNKEGFLFPYHEALEYQKDHPDFDPKTIAVIIPNEFRLEFSFATEHVSHDFALYILRESIKKIELAKELKLGSNWDDTIEWISKKLEVVKELRGDYPGLGAALTVFGLERGHFLAQNIFNTIDKKDCPWSYLDKVFKNPELISPDLHKSIHKENIELWNSYRINQKGRLNLLQLISRFNLNKEQADIIFNKTKRQKKYQNVSDDEILANPYVLFEISNNSIEPISYSVIDTGLMLNRDKELLPKITGTFHPLSKERIRALTVMQLERHASNGHTLYPEEGLINNIADLPIEPPCNLNADYFKNAASIFDSAIMTHFTSDDKIAYQLIRFNAVAELINTTINKRLKGNRHNLIENWEEYLNEIDFKNTDVDKKAKIEKISALEEMANARFSVLIGQAGSGKTTLLSALASIPKIKQGNVLFLAPTGKARVRMEEKAKKYGVTAKTIASFLFRSKRFKGSTQSYQLNDSPKEMGYKTVIIDECSMLTEEMLAATLQHLKGVQRLILVGDYRQLPPIGAGRPFFDIINYIKPAEIDNQFPKVSNSYIELTTSARQVEIDNKGRLDRDFANLFGGKVLDNDADEIFESVIAGESENIKIYNWDNENDFEELLYEVLESELDINDTISFNKSIGSEDGSYFNWNKAVNKVENWQLLSPVRAKVFGTTQLNRSLHKKFKKDTIHWANKGRKTPGPFGSEEIVYGDKVINLSNHSRDKGTYPNDGINYVANGEIGVTVGRCNWKNGRFGKSPYQLEVEFSSQKGYKYQFTSKDFSEENGQLLELAYALTIHKAQGSQFKTVLLVIPEPCLLLSRELIYTSLTRQEDKVIVMYQGNSQLLYNYTNDYYSASLQRITNLFYKPNITKLKERFFERNLIHCASDGKLLRSKSEVIIYETLLKYDLEPAYEYELKMGTTVKRPDFYVSDDDSGVDYYWEHLGMLSDPTYSKKWQQKLEWYKSNDILPLEEGGGQNGTLIISRDDAKGGISVKEITEKIENIFELEPKPKSVDEITKLTEIVLELRNEVKSQISNLTSEFVKIKKSSEFSDNKIDLIYAILDKESRTDNIQDYYELVKLDFEDYQYFEDNSTKFLASAYFLKEKLESLETDDYSPFILQFSRAIENEILNKLFLPFYKELDLIEDLETFLKDEFTNRGSGLFAKALSKKSEKFTLGTMNTLLSFIHKPEGKTLKSSNLLLKFREHVLSLVEPGFLINENMQTLETITRDYRNKAAHIGSINNSDTLVFKEVGINIINELLKSLK